MVVVVVGVDVVAAVAVVAVVAVGRRLHRLDELLDFLEAALALDLDELGLLRLVLGLRVLGVSGDTVLE